MPAVRIKDHWREQRLFEEGERHFVPSAKNHDVRPFARAIGEHHRITVEEVLSAHRSPEETARFARDAKKRGLGVFICGAGAAAHLAGAVSAQTTLPVLGVPLDASGLGGLDALLATVQMPAGIPVGTLAIGRAGATNAALLAAAVLALHDDALAARLDRWRTAQTAAVAEHPKDDEVVKA